MAPPWVHGVPTIDNSGELAAAQVDKVYVTDLCHEQPLPAPQTGPSLGTANQSQNPRTAIFLVKQEHVTVEKK